MQVIIAGIALFGAVGIIILTSKLDIGTGVKAAIATLVVFIAVYCMARIQSKETTSKKDTEK